MPKQTEGKADLEKLLKEKLKVLKPDECALAYDEKKGVLIGVCNKDGKLKFRRLKIPQE